MDTTVIAARLSVIRECVNALIELRPLTYEEFVAEHILVAAAERDLQVAIQAALDIGSTLLAGESAGFPQRYSDIFPALGDMGVLPQGFAARLADMARFRNVLVHLYVEVDTALVYRHIQDDLGDFEEFACYVSTWLQEQDARSS